MRAGCLEARHRFLLVARFDDDVVLRLEGELQHRPQGVFVFNEQDRCRRSGGFRRHGYSLHGLTQPARRHTGAARFVFDGGDGFLVLVELLLQPFELGQRAVQVLLNLFTLDTVVAIDEVRAQ